MLCLLALSVSSCPYACLVFSPSLSHSLSPSLPLSLSLSLDLSTSRPLDLDLSPSPSLSPSLSLSLPVVVISLSMALLSPSSLNTEYTPLCLPCSARALPFSFLSVTDKHRCGELGMECCDYGWSAAPGWDAVTGLGSSKNLLNILSHDN